MYRHCSPGYHPSSGALGSKAQPMEGDNQGRREHPLCKEYSHHTNNISKLEILFSFQRVCRESSVDPVEAEARSIPPSKRPVHAPRHPHTHKTTLRMLY